MPAKIDRTGEKVVCRNGLEATIITWNGHRDFDVQFEDGEIVHCKFYEQFTEGRIRHPHRRVYESKNYSFKFIGETFRLDDGRTATVIKAYNNKKRWLVDVQLSTGEVIQRRKFYDIKKGILVKPKEEYDNRVGEVTTCKNGLKATVIGYNRNDSMDIQFEDGTVVENKVWCHFSNKMIAHPKYTHCDYVCTLNSEKWFLCTCRKCKHKHMIRLQDMKDFECKLGDKLCKAK